MMVQNKLHAPAVLAIVVLGLLFVVRPVDAQQSVNDLFLIAQQQTARDLKPDFPAYKAYLKTDDLLIFQAVKEGISGLGAEAFFCKTLPLAQPMDSVLSLIFHTSRRLQAGALQIRFDDTCKVRVIIKPQFRTSALPVKELNLFLSDKLVQDEIYIDLDLFTVLKDRTIDLSQILLFEYLFQQFLQEKIARRLMFSRSVLAMLIDATRPVYEPELHLYLDGKAAWVLIKKWQNIKQAFKKQILSAAFVSKVEQFNQKLPLMYNSDYNRLVGLSKMLARYGSFKPLKEISLSGQTENPDMLRRNMNYLTEHLIVYWFKPGELNQKLMDSLKNEIGEQNLLIFK